MKRGRGINRRTFLHTLAGGTFTLAMGSRLPFGEEKEKAPPPNIVLILTDDQGYQDLGCYGSPDIKTPRIDGLAAEGMRFTDFYSAAPICTPSRAALLTGCYPLRVSLPTVLLPDPEYPQEGLNTDEITIAELLKTRGYATALIGKWHLGEPPDFLPTLHGFDEFYGIPFTNAHPDNARIKFPRLMRGGKILEQPADPATLTKKCTTEALQFIQKNKVRPFFLYLAHPMPHTPLGASKEFLGKSSRGLYGDVISEIDWSTGQILDLLKSLGLKDKTLVIFASDNGPQLGPPSQCGSTGPLRGAKFTVYEGGMRVPCIMRWPGKISPQTVCSEVAAAIDLLPTLAYITGAKVPADRIIDGKNIWPLLSGDPNSKSPHEAFYYYYLDTLRAVRMGKWKLHLPLWVQDTEGKILRTIKPELYNLEKDPGEQKNVADSRQEVMVRLLSLAVQFDKALRANQRPSGKRKIIEERSGQ